MIFGEVEEGTGRPWPLRLANLWRRVGTAASRLTGRHRMKRAWTRDVWRPASRFWRKTLSHT